MIGMSLEGNSSSCEIWKGARLEVGNLMVLPLRSRGRMLLLIEHLTSTHDKSKRF